MSPVECRLETDVVEAVRSGRWPDRLDAGLRAHVASCAQCGEVLDVALAIGAAPEEGTRDAHVPAAAQVWWRIQVRARQDAVASAARPVTVAQGVAAASAAGLAVAAIGMGWPRALSMAGVLDAPRGLADAGLLMLASFLARAPETVVLAAGAVVAGLLLMPVVVYLALTD